MKRCLALLLLLAALVGVMAVPASAASAATRVDTTISINADGDASVSMTLLLHLETPDASLVFPLPAGAENVTVNGSPARTEKTSSAVNVSIGSLTDDMAGDFTISFGYTLPGVVAVDPEMKNSQGEYMLRLDLPLLNSFSYPVNELKFIITLPASVVYVPSFYSTYRQTSFESDIERNIQGNMISGISKSGLNDHESIAMAMYVTEDMFPGVSTYLREGNPEIWPMLGLAGAALLYWLLFLRCLPLIRTRTVSPPEGLTAGELGCHLTFAGVDLTTMVMSWSQMGYLLIQLDGNRVLLHKRMEMGNERGSFERKIYKALFGSRRMVDATGQDYALLHKKTARAIPGEGSLIRSNPIHRKIFRALLCAAQVFCGICVAMNMTVDPIWQKILSVVLGLLGAVSAWQIHEIVYRNHLRGKTRVYIGMICMAIWIALGFACGEILIPTVTVIVQYLMGYLAAYGERRSEVGRHNAGRILGLRAYLKKIDTEEIKRIQKSDPEYFFNMAPYALTLGILRPFARNFGARKLDQCPYLMTRVHGRRSADEWADMIITTADLMDARQRRMEFEKWTQLPKAVMPKKRTRKRRR